MSRAVATRSNYTLATLGVRLRPACGISGGAHPAAAQAPKGCISWWEGARSRSACYNPKDLSSSVAEQLSGILGGIPGPAIIHPVFRPLFGVGVCG